MKWKRFGRRMKIMLLITFLIWSMLTPAFHFTQAEQGQLPEDMNSGEMEKTEKEQGDTEEAPVEDAKPLKQETKKIKDFTAENKAETKNEFEEEQEPKSNQVQQMNVQVMNVDDFVYTDNGDGTATITGYNGSATDLNIPATLGGLTVTSIGDSAFRDMGLETVVISDSVRNIGKWAFMNNNLTTVTIPHGVKNLDNFVFADNALTSINLSDSLETIGYYSFYNNNLGTVTIPDNVSIIDIGAFRNNDLEHVTIPDGVETIEALAFENNYLTSIDLSNRLTTIEASAFEKNRLREVIIPDSVTGIGEGAFSWNQLTEVVIPKSVTSIGAGAFEYNQLDPADFTIYGYEDSAAETYANDNRHTFIHITTDPENVYEWEENDDGGATITGYYGDETEIVIPDELGGLTVTKIQDRPLHEGVFNEKEITSITLPENLEHIGNSAFANNQLIEVIIPNSVTSIGDWAFYYSQLTEIIIPDSVSSIGDWAFADNQLTEVVIPNSVTSIGNFVFSINQLTEVVIPDSVTSIGTWAFADNQLTKVVIPNSVTSIGSSAFVSNQLTEVVIPDSVTSIGGYVFGSNQSNLADLTIYGYEDSVAETYANDNGHTFINIKTLPENIYEWRGYTDGTAAITGYKGNAKELDIPKTLGGLTVTSIASMAFNNKGLTKVIIPDSVTRIEERAFSNNNLTEVVVSDSVMTIGYMAFRNNNLTEVVIPNSVTSLGGEAFSNNQLTELVIPNSVTAIGHATFRNNKLTKVVIPDSVTSIWLLAFADNQLTEVIIPDSVTNIGSTAFENNQSDPADLTIYGYESSEAETQATTNDYQFKALDSLPVVDIYFNDELLENLLSGDGFLSVDYEAKGELKATYSHELEDHDFVKLEIENVSWKIAEVSDLVEGDTLELASYTNSVSKRTVTLTVETNYGGKSIKKFTLDISPPVPNVSDLTIDEVTETSISLSWGGVDYADEYILKRDGIEVYRGSSTSYTDTGLEPNISYTYSLVAVNDTGESDASTQTAKTKLSSSSGGGGSGYTPSPDATLKKLQILEGNTNLINFDSDQLEYELEIEAKAVELVVKPADSRAKVKVNDKIVEEKTIRPLEEGENVFEIVVIAENGIAQKYLVTIHRLQEVPFPDIKGHWAEGYMKKAYRNGWLKGYPNGIAGPEDHITRIQATSLLVRIFGLTEGEAVPFTDIDNVGAEMMAELEIAYTNGIVNGFPNQTFKPYQAVTRAQLALMIYRSYEIVTSTPYEPKQQADFTDITDYDEETKNAIAMLVELGIAEGSEGQFLPSNHATRAHAAKMLVIYKEVLTKLK